MKKRLVGTWWLAIGFAFAATRPVANYDEAKVHAGALPDPLVCRDGTPVRDVATWQTKRRPELIELFEQEVYGRTPGGRPEKMHWKMTSVDRTALGGKAVRKEITVWFAAGENAPRMHLLIYQPIATPAAHAPWPVFLGLNFGGNQTIAADPGITLSSAWMRTAPDAGVVNNRATEASRGAAASRWQIETVLARGYAVATAYCGDLCPDRAEGLTDGVGPLFGHASAGERAPDAWGAIGMWAWGLSRAMDYLASDTELDAKHVAVHGHSRLGKAALWAAAQDERFALVISNESGCAGAKIGRRNYGQTVTDITIAFPFWFCRNFAAYQNREHELPVDQHELLALIAPRALYVASAEGDRWSDPRGEFLGLKGAEPVYRLFGRRGLSLVELPPLETPVASDVLGYHIRRGSHDINAYDWARYLDFADRLWKP